jgi:putative ABC transport system substrate-binding protein
MPVIGFFRSTTLADSAYIVTAFREGLKEAGFVEGQNVTVEYRFADNQKERLTGMAVDLVREGVAVIVGNNITAPSARAATSTIPIIFVTGGDPVHDGLVASLNRPGGNVTGVVFFNSVLGGKRLELLHQLVPKATTIAMFVNSNTPNTEAERIEVQAAARAIGQQLIVFDVNSAHDIDAAFSALVQRGAGALFVGSGAFLNSNQERLVAMAVRYGLPTSYAWREAAVIGGLMSYGASVTEAYRQAGVYTGRILKGEKPVDLPVIQATKFEFVINLKTAKSLALTLPLVMQMTANEVIE